MDTALSDLALFAAAVFGPVFVLVAGAMFAVFVVASLLAVVFRLSGGDG